MPTCLTCRFFAPQLTATGKVKRAAGRCLYVLPDIALPISEFHLRREIEGSPQGRSAVWPDEKQDCPVHEPKDPQ